jgi:hypothetical protein
LRFAQATSLRMTNARNYWYSIHIRKKRENRTCQRTPPIKS